MIERRWRPTDPELARALRQLGENLAYPATPDVAAGIRRRLDERSTPKSWWSFSMPRRAAAVATLLGALLAAILAVSPEARSAVADRLGLRGISIFHVPHVADPTPSPPPTASSTATTADVPRSGFAAWPAPSPAAGVGLLLGQPLTLDEARARAPFPVLTPNYPELGPPNEVYFGEPPLGGQVSMVWRARPSLPSAAVGDVGLLLTQFQGALDPTFYGKALGPGTRLAELTVDGARALWMEGQPHLFIYRNRRGAPTDEQVRLSGNVLLWERGELTLRLESALGRDEALRIAESVR